MKTRAPTRTARAGRAPGARPPAARAPTREQQLTAAIIASIPGTFYVLDAAAHFVRWNQAQQQLIGLPAARMRTLNALTLVHADDRSAAAAELAKTLRTGQGAITLRLVFQPGQPPRHFLLTGRRLEAQGRPYLVGCGLDITAQLRAKAALRAARAQLAAVLESTPDLIWSVDPRTQELLSFNPAFAADMHRAFGIVVRRGQRLPDFLPARELPVWQALLRRAVHSGHCQQEYYRPRPPRYFEVNLHPLPATGQVSIFARDITARKRSGRRLLAAIEREQRRIGQDLHDGVGQQLAALRNLCTALQRRLQAKRVAEHREAARLAGLLDGTLQQVRALAHGLLPVGADSQGLMAGLRALAQQTTQLFDIPCAFICPRPVLVSEPHVATHLYRIAQEAARNAAVHARPPHLRIRLERRQGALQLVVQDDGPGLPPAPAHGQGLGLEIMKYRAAAIGGHLEIRSRPGRGTTIRCVLPPPLPQEAAP